MILLADMPRAATDFGVTSQQMDAVDIFVLINVAFLFFVLGIGAVCAWLLWRRKHHPKPHVRLLMELEDSDPLQPPSPPVSKQTPWEKDADWWKKD
jgi:hypothetical protein